jgi:DNA-binding protein HU-beta
MNKGEFITYVAKRNNCIKIEAEQIINTFTDAVTGAMEEGNEVVLLGFGNFYISKFEARTGRNPKTGDAVAITARNQAKFKAGQKLKDAVNKR